MAARIGGHAGPSARRRRALLQGAVSEQARGFARDNALALLEGDALATLLLKAPPPKT